MSERTFLKFSAGSAAFGLPVTEVVETIRVVAFAPVPSAAPDLLGVINLRGRVIPVFDLLRTLEMGERPITVRMYIIIASVGTESIGVLVDDVLGVVTVPADQYQVSRALGGLDSFAAGVVRSGPDMLTVLNLHPLLDRARLEPAAG